MPNARDFFEFALEWMKHQHDELSDAWKQVDSKAQATATIAGVFLAAAYAFVRNESPALGMSERVVLCVAVVSLVTAIGMSGIAMLTKSAFFPITGNQAARMVKEALRFPTEASDRYIGLLSDTLDNWCAVNARLLRDVNTKAKRLRWAQCALLVSAIAILIVTIIAIFNNPKGY